MRPNCRRCVYCDLKGMDRVEFARHVYTEHALTMEMYEQEERIVKGISDYFHQ